RVDRLPAGCISEVHQACTDLAARGRQPGQENRRRFDTGQGRYEPRSEEGAGAKEGTGAKEGAGGEEGSEEGSRSQEGAGKEAVTAPAPTITNGWAACPPVFFFPRARTG